MQYRLFEPIIRNFLCFVNEARIVLLRQLRGAAVVATQRKAASLPVTSLSWCARSYTNPGVLLMQVWLDARLSVPYHTLSNRLLPWQCISNYYTNVENVADTICIRQTTLIQVSFHYVYVYVIQLSQLQITKAHSRFSCRRGTARRCMSDEILSTAAQLYENWI